MLSNQFFLWQPRRLLPSRVSSLALQGVFSCPPRALQDVFCNGVVSSDVAKPGELASFCCCQRRLLLSSNGVHVLSHIFVCPVVGIRNTEEADVSALPDSVKS